MTFKNKLLSREGFRHMKTVAITANLSLFVLSGARDEAASTMAGYLIWGVPLTLCAAMAALAFTEPPGRKRANGYPQFTRVIVVFITIGWLFYGSFWGYVACLFFSGGISLV